MAVEFARGKGVAGDKNRTTVKSGPLRTFRNAPFIINRIRET